jgi:hypothetical protein
LLSLKLEFFIIIIYWDFPPILLPLFFQHPASRFLAIIKYVPVF